MNTNRAELIESHTETQFLNIAAYKFARLTNLAERRERLRDLTRELSLRGTILLSEEGINLFMAGLPVNVRQRDGRDSSPTPRLDLWT